MCNKAPINNKTIPCHIMFKDNIKLEELAKFGQNSMQDHLGIEFLELGSDYIKARMPVDNRTKQPFGILHGGASVALAETLGSIASAATLDLSKKACVGLEINANHIRSVSNGFVYGIARPFHIGGSTQVWEIKITDEKDRLVCVSRITMMVIDRK
ncbi:hotdog fold thioesterase [Peijinzhouia sedimentorum]